MTVLRFTVPGTPQPKQRARFTRAGHAYTPKATKAYERAVWFAAMAAKKEREQRKIVSFEWPLDAWYRCEVLLYTQDRRIPDSDNVSKAILDGCQGVLWANDRRVIAPHPTLVEVCCPEPRAEVTVTIIDPPRGWERRKKVTRG